MKNCQCQTAVNTEQHNDSWIILWLVSRSPGPALWTRIISGEASHTRQCFHRQRSKHHLTSPLVACWTDLAVRPLGTFEVSASQSTLGLCKLHEPRAGAWAEAATLWADSRMTVKWFPRGVNGGSGRDRFLLLFFVISDDKWCLWGGWGSKLDWRSNL